MEHEDGDGLEGVWPKSPARLNLKNAAEPTQRRKGAKTQGFRLLGTFTPVVIGRVHALEGGGTKSGWQAANRGVGQDLDASV
jgi:hypothetical protein